MAKSVDPIEETKWMKKRRWYIPRFIMEMILDDEMIYLGTLGITDLEDTKENKWSFWDYLFDRVWHRNKE